METKRAVQNLRELKVEAQELTWPCISEFSSWRGRVNSVLTRALGAHHHLVAEFANVYYSLESDDDYHRDVAKEFKWGMESACGLIEAAIFDLELGGTSDDAIDESAFDRDLWMHVQAHVQNEDWQTVASQTAIFVEDRIRKWCGGPTAKDGRTLVGKGLYAVVFADDGEYRLGNERGEWEGWRMLSMGFAQALSNVDRHNIQRRADAKLYAIGVLGLGSLILTQLRHVHGEHLTVDIN
jgi:hypothetical protein